MKQYLIKTIRWSIGCLIFFAGACTQTPVYKKLVITKEDSIAGALRIKNAYSAILSASKKLQSGYLITRTGSDFTSECLRSLNQRNKTYSHCGIVSIEHDSIFVYHALGGEWNPDQKIKRDPLLNFADPHNNKGIGIFSFELGEIAVGKLIDTVQRLYTKGVMFDMDFDLQTDGRMYCAEFVCKSYERSGGALHFNHSHIKEFEFVGIDDIFLDPHCIVKDEIVYK